MSDINWDLAPEGAAELREHAKFGYLRWFNRDGAAWEGCKWFDSDVEYKTIATRPQPERKTVEDAVAEHKGKWPFSHGIVLMGYSPKHDHFFAFGEGYHFCNGEYLVCTREEFEACVAAKGEGEGERWTHITNSGQECKIHVEKPDVNGVIIVINSSGEYMRHSLDGLKPIKPTITKSKMLSMIECRALSDDDDDEFGAKVRDWLEQYAITN